MAEPSEADRVRDALPAILAAHPHVAGILDRSCLLLHGSTTIGMARATSDWDLWVLSDDATHAAFAAAHGTRFVEFTAARIGHFQVESIAEFGRRVAGCDMELISELRHGIVMADPAGVATDLLREARKPMSHAVRNAWFRYHYVEMRGEHKAVAGAVDQHDNPVAVMIGVGKVIEHALRAAMVIDGEPYRYSK
jgi:hypothetical protein